MSSDSPHVSVLLPVFNGQPWIGSAVESILGQTFQDWELIVVDDGSLDGTRAVLRGYNDPRVRVVCHEKNRGLVAALNTGLAECRGQWIARMDADDVSLPGRLMKQVQFLETHPAVGVLGTWWRLTDTKGTSWVHELPEEHEAIQWRLLFSYSLAHPTTVNRTDLVRQAGGYDAAFTHVEDIDLWTRLLKSGARFANLPETLYERRVHDASICAIHSGVQNERYRILRGRMLQEWFGLSLDNLDTMLLVDVLSGDRVLTGKEMRTAVTLLLDLYERFVRDKLLSSSSMESIRSDLTGQIVDIAQRNGYVHPKIAKQWWRWVIPAWVKGSLKRLRSHVQGGTEVG